MRRLLRNSAALATLLTCATGLFAAPAAQATEWVYLLNVTVRPGYNFANADHALSYGYGICDKIRHGRGFPDLVSDLKADFNTSDEFSASYLLSQASQELCPELIWQLRNSAAGYRPTG